MNIQGNILTANQHATVRSDTAWYALSLQRC